MAFIDKKNPVVLNIKLTSKGRELLSEGNLNFGYYAIGDSEMDYAFNNQVTAELDLIGQSYTPFDSHILRPADKNPSLLSFIPRNLDGDPYNLITNVPSTPTIIQNTAQPLGFFSIISGETTFITDTDHVKQPDAMVEISGVTGGTFLYLKKAPTYIANVNEPSIGDLLLVKWTNPYSQSTTGYVVSANTPTAYLVYKIQGFSGTLANNTLVVQVDRDLPNFTNLTGGSNSVVAGAMIYYDYINYTGTSIFNDYSTDYVNEAITSFLQNCQCPTITFPFWNMTIIYTNDIVGVQEEDRGYGQYRSKTYGGFVSYIQNQEPTIKKLGVIHYTNSSPSNTYAEELYQNTPTLELPTIMWHKSTEKKLGAKFKAMGSVQSLTGITRSLNTAYYNLYEITDTSLQYPVGKVFVDLKIFVIEDQELLFAMSYKSNRSWTLPNYNVGINDNVIVGCAQCELQYQVTLTPASTIGGNDGSIYIHDIELNYGSMVLEVSGNSGVFIYEPIVGNTTIGGLVAGNYRVTIYDMGSPDCAVTTNITLTQPTSLLKLYGVQTTASGLDPNFDIISSSPTSIRIYKSDVGSVYGTARIALKPYGQVPGVGDYALLSTYVDFNSLTFTQPYSIYVKDSGTGFEFIVHRDYVAAGTPLNAGFNTSQGQDTGGTYMYTSNYIQAIVPFLNPVVGDIELSIYPTSSVPTTWIAGGTTYSGTPKKLYVSTPSYTSNYYTVAVRERWNNIVMYTVTKQVTFMNLSTTTTTAAP